MSTGNNSQTPRPEEDTFMQKAIGFLSRQLTNTDSFGAYLEPVVQLIKPQWRHGRISATVVMIKNESDNMYTLTLKPERKWKQFIAGQYVHLSVEKDGAMLTRTFSLSCSPKHFLDSGEITLTIRAHENGAITPWINQSLRSGDHVYITEAEGDFLLSASKKDKVFIAGGSGLTPLFSILSENQNQPWLRNAQLLFYVNNSRSLFFTEKLSHLQSLGLQLNVIYSDEEGFINQDHLEKYINDIPSKEFYVCGPGTMIETTQELLQGNNVPQTDIHFEYFGKQPLSLKGLENDAEDSIQVDYLDSNKQVSFNPEEFLESDKTTLLEISEQQGLRPVSGCRIGVCHQCICKKKTGRVFNTRTQQYSDSGAEEIQLCVSVPVGKVELEL